MGLVTTPSLEDYVAGIAAGDRQLLSRAITLIESSRQDHAKIATELLARLMPRTGNARRVGITGAPGVGKSTFIDALGSHLTALDHRVAVLAIDPQSQRSGGSILGDKTRMARLSRDPRAFIRPSPGDAGHGGVAQRTREVALLCEAAGYDAVLIETIGTGQSEVAVANMVDTFLAMVLAGSGDELQGIKRGVMELADVIVVHKADGEQLAAAQRASGDYAAAQRLLHGGRHDGWLPPVLCVSSVTGAGLEAVWQEIEAHRAALGDDGIATKRRQQALDWFDQAVVDRLRAHFLADPEVAAKLPRLRQQVLDGSLQPVAAARALL